MTTDSVRGGMRARGGLLLELLNFLNRKIYFFRSYTNESGKNMILASISVDRSCGKRISYLGRGTPQTRLMSIRTDFLLGGHPKEIILEPHDEYLKNTYGT